MKRWLGILVVFGPFVAALGLVVWMRRPKPVDPPAVERPAPEAATPVAPAVAPAQVQVQAAPSPRAAPTPAPAADSLSFVVKPEKSTPSARESVSLPGSNAQVKAIHSSRARLDKVLAFVRNRYPQAVLYSIDAIADGQGGASACMPPNDGWAYYFLTPTTRSLSRLQSGGGKQMENLEAFDCRGDVDWGHSPFPGKYSLHNPLPMEFIDSPKAVGLLAAVVADIPNRLPMRLLAFKTPMFKTHTVLWQIRVGNVWHCLDARDGKYLGWVK